MPSPVSCYGRGAYAGMCGGVYGALGNPWSSRALCRDALLSVGSARNEALSLEQFSFWRLETHVCFVFELQVLHW